MLNNFLNIKDYLVVRGEMYDSLQSFYYYYCYVIYFFLLKNPFLFNTFNYIWKTGEHMKR